MTRPARFRAMLGLILLVLVTLFAASVILHPWLVLAVVSGALSILDS